MNDAIWPCDRLNIRLSDGTVVAAPGAVVLDAFGRLEVRAVLRGEHHLRDIADNQPVSGVTAMNMNVEVPRAWPTRATFSPGGGTTDVALVPTECVLVDQANTQTWTRRAYHLKGLKCRGTTRATDGTRTITLAELAGLDPEDRRQGLIRGLLTVSEPNPSNNPADDVRPELLTLFSLAQRCQLSAPREDVFSGDDLIRVILRGNDFTADSTHPLIPPAPPELSAFLEQTLPAFRANAANYELERLTWYYCRAFMEQYGEARFIFAGVFMEALKFHWAKNVANYPTDVKANGLIRGFVKNVTPGGRRIHYTFEELVDGVAAHIGYNAAFTFIEDRNALFHTGAPAGAQLGAAGGGGTWALLKPELFKLYDQMEDLLLRILNYQGPIHPYDPTAAEKVEFPTRTPIV